MADLKRLRVDADTASQIIDAIGKDLHPVIREDIECQVALEETVGGPLDPLFMQGFFSGVKFMHDWLIAMKGVDSRSTFATSQVCIALAYEYTRIIERSVDDPP